MKINLVNFNSVKLNLVAGLIAGAGLAAAVLPVSPVNAQSVESFYKGKTMTMLVGFSSGSTNNRYARLLSRHIGKFIPGNPKFIVQEFPGSGGMKQANRLWTTAPKDGSVIGNINRSLTIEPLLFAGKSKAKFDPAKFNWIGSLNTETLLVVTWHLSPAKTIADLMTKGPIFVGAGGAASDSATLPNVMNALMGTQFKVITGFRGGNIANLAMEKGEIHGRVGVSWGAMKAGRLADIKSGKFKVLIQLAAVNNPEVPESPLVIDLLKTAEDKELFKFLISPAVIGRPFAAPPGIPADRLAAIRGAFDKVLTDADFIADAKKNRLNIVNPMSGAEVQKFVENLKSTPKKIVERAAAEINKGRKSIGKRAKK